MAERSNFDQRGLPRCDEGSRSDIGRYADFADGTMVDEFVNCGSKIMTAAVATFQAIDAIADTVHTFLDVTGDFISKVVGGVKSVAGLFGV